MRFTNTRVSPRIRWYKLVKKSGKEAILQDKEDGHLELWVKNDHYAGYVVVINGVGYEYARRVPAGKK